VEALMPSNAADQTSERALVHSPASFELSAVDRACVRHLVGHTLALIERELILQTLRYNQGNRTRAAGFLGISIRSLRDRIRNYRSQGEDVPEPESSSVPACPTAPRSRYFSH
jgi:two-component system response regulator FlrC